jgi:hypothetical protein
MRIRIKTDRLMLVQGNIQYLSRNSYVNVTVTFFPCSINVVVRHVEVRTDRPLFGSKKAYFFKSTIF